MIRSNFGAVRRLLLVSAVLNLSPLAASAQIVERSQTWANLIATHPCNAGLNGRHTILTDAQSSSSIGGGGGSTRVFVECDGVDTWSIVSIGGSGGGVTGLTSCADGTALADNALMRADGTTKCQGSTVTVADSTGNLQWEGTTADAFEGNFTFADPTADWTWNWTGTGIAQGSHLELATGTGSNFYGDASVSLVVNRGSNGFLMAFYNKDNGAAIWARSTDNVSVHQQFNSTSTIGWSSSFNNAGTNDTSIGRAAAGVVFFADGSTGGGALHLNPLASPPRTCDATAEGDIYSDTSHAVCWCDGTTWQKLSGAGTCA